MYSSKLLKQCILAAALVALAPISFADDAVTGTPAQHKKMEELKKEMDKIKGEMEKLKEDMKKEMHKMKEDHDKNKEKRMQKEKEKEKAKAAHDKQSPTKDDTATPSSD